MGRWGARAALASALGALALAGAGCGAEEHVNEPRPQVPTRVSVSVSEDRVTVQPDRIAFGPEPGNQIPQNRETGQPPVRAGGPLDVVLVAANLTDVDSRLEVRGPDRNATSQPLVANGGVRLQAALRPGVYMVHAADIPGAEPGRLAVGPYRVSSENELLLP